MVWIGALLVCASQATGCVERRYVINSQPQGALVYRSTGEYIGATPVDDYFVYYGKHEFILVKEGFEPLRVVQDIPAPWYEFPGIDFISENLNPFKVRDVRTFCYALQPAQAVRPDDLFNKASQLRVRGQGIGAPREPRPVPPTSVQPPPSPMPGAVPPAGGVPLGPPVPSMPPAMSTTGSGRFPPASDKPFNGP
jgi:hypothetical protein